MNKIIHRFQLNLICAFVFLLACSRSVAQATGTVREDTTLNKYGLWVIRTTGQLIKTVQNDPAKAMTDLKKHIPDLVFDLRYAGENNFMHEKLYPPLTTTFLRRVAADSLSAVQKELQKIGLGLKIFDAYRPYAVTEKLWEPVKDDRYAADPKKGSGHNRGIAADLTLINLSNMQELNMGTGFDNFSDTAHHTFTQLPEEVLQNRLLLKTIMESHGFKSLESEWWHYYLIGARDFELMDIPFEELLNIKN